MAARVNPVAVGNFKRLCGASAVVLTLTVGALACSTITLAQNSDRVKAGLVLWKTAGCADCHGPFADGDREDDDFPIGANLRTSRLDPSALRTTIRCGRAGTGMPSFDEEAYTTRECYGRPQGTRPGNLQPTPRTLTPDEIDAVIAYLQARIIGRGKITREECLSYYEDQPDTCEDYK
jgi:mono/diheme cytochrome c family protein